MNFKLSYDEEELLDYFRRQCCKDSSYINYMISINRWNCLRTGAQLKEGYRCWSFIIDGDKDEEYIDFIDGNGFYVHKLLEINGHSTYIIGVMD